MKSYKDKQLLFGLLFLGLAGGALGHGFERLGLTVPASRDLGQAAAFMATETNIAPQVLPAPSITLGFAGDIMLARGVASQVKKNLGGDWNKLFLNAGFLAEPDVTFANLEGPVSDRGLDRHNLYSFRMDPSVVPALKAAGIDIVASANNHIGDWGPDALADTITHLRAGGIATCGIGMNKSEAETPAVFARDGYTVGFLCFTDVGPNDMAATETTPGILLASDPDYDGIIKRAAEQVDALIVSFHWGEEYQAKHNSRQEELARRAIDSGAAMVEGEHPHVAEDTDTYRGAPIFYSLGNFIFDQAFSKETTHGLFITAAISGKSVSDIATHITTYDKNFAPRLEK